MPYISIKAWHKDEEIKKKVVEEVNKVFIKYWCCPQEEISISMEEFDSESWEEKVVKHDIEPNTDKMMIYCGKKMY